MRGRCARGEVFIAVGDEGGQRVDVVGVLHHRDLVGLSERERGKQGLGTGNGRCAPRPPQQSIQNTVTHNTI